MSGIYYTSCKRYTTREDLYQAGQEQAHLVHCCLCLYYVIFVQSMLKMNTFDLGVVVLSFIKPIYLKTEGAAPSEGSIE